MQLVKPQNITHSLDDLPKTDKTVKAITLLTPEEKILARNAACIGISYEGKACLVMTQAQVPEGATALRGSQGLVGISAVVGG